MPTLRRMELGLYDARGHRKYLTTAERTAFLTAAEEMPREVRTLCGLLAHTGCRLSEGLLLTADRVDLRADLLVFETLKKRRAGVYRALPVPHALVDMLDLVHGLRALQGRPDRGRHARLWPLSRMTGWRRVRDVMAQAGIRGPHGSPKGLRHGFGVAAVTAGVPLNLVQKWLGHAQLSTTAIYADAVGAEEHAIAIRMWRIQEQYITIPLPPPGYEMPMRGHALHQRFSVP
jgi:integrase/recombinase XerD